MVTHSVAAVQQPRRFEMKRRTLSILVALVMALGVVAVAFEIDVSFNADYHARFLRTNVELK